MNNTHSSHLNFLHYTLYLKEDILQIANDVLHWCFHRSNPLDNFILHNYLNDPLSTYLVYVILSHAQSGQRDRPFGYKIFSIFGLKILPGSVSYVSSGSGLNTLSFGVSVALICHWRHGNKVNLWNGIWFILFSFYTTMYICFYRKLYKNESMKTQIHKCYFFKLHVSYTSFIKSFRSVLKIINLNNYWI